MSSKLKPLIVAAGEENPFKMSLADVETTNGTTGGGDHEETKKSVQEEIEEMIPKGKRSR